MDYQLLVEQSDIQQIVERLRDSNHLFEDKTILITGGSGFLGRVFCKYFLSLNHCTVISMDNYTTGARTAPTHPNLATIDHDVTKVINIESPVDFIINACGIASPYHYRRLPLETLDVSYLGARNMMNLALDKHVTAFLSFSSSEVYGDPPADQVPTPEAFVGRIPTTGSRACYDEGKRVIETLSHIYHEKYGLRAKIVRPFNVFGPPLAQNDYRVLPNFMNHALRKQPLTVYGDGLQTRTFCYVTDFIVGAIRVLLYGDPLPYNIGNSDNEISMVALAELVREITGLEAPVSLIPYPAAYPSEEPRRRCPDLHKATHLSYKPIVSLRDGIQRFYDWAKANYTV